jgi:hypothetical protein
MVDCSPFLPDFTADPDPIWPCIVHSFFWFLLIGGLAELVDWLSWNFVVSFLAQEDIPQTDSGDSHQTVERFINRSPWTEITARNDSDKPK